LGIAALFFGIAGLIVRKLTNPPMQAELCKLLFDKHLG
jgi:hypothetical protein